MRTAHLISNELFLKALHEIQQGHCQIVYDSSKYLLELQDMYFLRNEVSAKVFIEIYAPSPENMQTFKANSLMEIYNHFEIEQSLKEHSQLKNKIMNDKNLEDLSKKLMYTGFGEGLNEQLKEKMISGEKEFVLNQETKYGKDEVAATLQFRKSDTTDMYFFNRYHLALKNDQHPDPIKQTFFINHMQDNVTLKEAYNLMSGRAVYKELQNKEGEKYNAWIQLDFKQTEASGNYKMRSFNDNWGFRLDEVLSKYPIAGLKNDEEKKLLVDSLQRGNRQSVTFEEEGKQTRVFIEAVPQYRGLNFYDQHMNKKLPHELGTKLSEDKQKAQKKSVDEEAGDVKKKNGKRKGI